MEEDVQEMLDVWKNFFGQYPPISKNLYERLATALKNEFENDIGEWTAYCRTIQSSDYLTNPRTFNLSIASVINPSFKGKVLNKELGVKALYENQDKIQRLKKEEEKKAYENILEKEKHEHPLCIHIRKIIVLERGATYYLTYLEKTELSLKEGKLHINNMTPSFLYDCFVANGGKYYLSLAESLYPEDLKVQEKNNDKANAHQQIDSLLSSLSSEQEIVLRTIANHCPEKLEVLLKNYHFHIENNTLKIGMKFGDIIEYHGVAEIAVRAQFSDILKIVNGILQEKTTHSPCVETSNGESKSLSKPQETSQDARVPPTHDARVHIQEKLNHKIINLPPTKNSSPPEERLPPNDVIIFKTSELSESELEKETVLSLLNENNTSKVIDADELFLQGDLSYFPPEKIVSNIREKSAPNPLGIDSHDLREALRNRHRRKKLTFQNTPVETQTNVEKTGHPFTSDQNLESPLTFMPQDESTQKTDMNRFMIDIGSNCLELSVPSLRKAVLLDPHHRVKEEDEDIVRIDSGLRLNKFDGGNVENAARNSRMIIKKRENKLFKYIETVILDRGDLKPLYRGGEDNKMNRKQVIMRRVSKESSKNNNTRGVLIAA